MHCTGFLLNWILIYLDIVSFMNYNCLPTCDNIEVIAEHFKCLQIFPHFLWTFSVRVPTGD